MNIMADLYSHGREYMLGSILFFFFGQLCSFIVLLESFFRRSNSLSLTVIF